MTVRRVVLEMAVAALPLSAVVRPAAAQHAEVFYDHRPGTAGDDRVRYLLPGERRSANPVNDAMHAGHPGRIEVAKGSEACFVVLNANPLLYSYSLGKKAVTVEAPAGLGEIITGLSGLLKTLGGMSLNFAGDPEHADADADGLIWRYTSEIVTLSAFAPSLDSLKRESDDEPDLSAVFRRVRQREAELLEAQQHATARYDSALKAAKGDEGRLNTIRLLRSVHESAVKQATALVKEFKAAESAPPPRLCATLESSRLRLTLNVAPKFKPREGERAARPADVVLEFDADPVSVERFEVLPAWFVGFSVSGAMRFSLRDNVIGQGSDRRPISSPGVLALGRVGDSPVWGAIGISNGRDQADAFLGLVLRGGPSIVGSRLLIGGGLTLARVVTDLKSGRVGEALPADVKKLDDLFVYEYRPGASVVFSLTGLAIGGGSKTPSGGAPPAPKPGEKN